MANFQGNETFRIRKVAQVPGGLPGYFVIETRATGYAVCDGVVTNKEYRVNGRHFRDRESLYEYAAELLAEQRARRKEEDEKLRAMYPNGIE